MRADRLHSNQHCTPLAVQSKHCNESRKHQKQSINQSINSSKGSINQFINQLNQLIQSNPSQANIEQLRRHS
jgi:hypothetical protein